MDKEQLFNDGIEILQSKLENWLKHEKIEENSKNQYFIFLPKIDNLRQEGIKISFPIYKSSEENNYNLNAWFESYLCSNKQDEYKEPELDNVVSEKIDFFNYGTNKELVALFAQIFFLSMNLKKCKINSQEYYKNRDILYDAIENYNEKICKIGNGEFVLKEAHHKEKKQNVVIAKENEKQNEIKENEEMDKYDEIIERLNRGNSEDKKYDFEWEDKNGLRYVSDEILEIAYMLIERGKISLKYDGTEENAKIKISSIIESLCNEKLNTINLLEKLKANENEVEDVKIFNTEEKTRVFTSKNGTLGSVCYTKNCKFQKCPKAFAGYILYLKNNGLLKESLKDREKFRKQNKTNPYFDFTWEVQNGVKEIPEDMYEFSNKLVEKNKVIVNNILDKSGNVRIQSLISCNEFKMINNDIDKIPERANEDSWRSITKPLNTTIDLCSRYTCRLDSCPFSVAGYIYYMKKIGKEAELLADRKYYLANKAKIDIKIKENKIKKLENLSTKKEEKIEEFKDYIGIVKNLNTILDGIVDKTKTNFHCIVSGNDENERTEFINKIQNLLDGEEKIKAIRRITMQNFSSLNIHTAEIGIIEKGDLYYSDSWRGDSRTPPAFKTDLAEIPYKNDGAIRRNQLEENTLYILSEVSEFIEEYTYYIKNTKSEIKKKELMHTLDLITNMIKNNYIIIDSTLDEVDKFLSMDARLKFVYQNNIIELPELTIEDMYELYLKNIKVEIREDIRKDSNKYKKLFNEYVSLNKTFMPFNNRGLVNYLVMYSNSKGEATFPESIYKKDNLEESLRNIIGLQNVKNQLKEIEKYMIFKLKAKANSLNLKEPNMHMVFAGNTGTGKTTIAKIVAKMLYDLGILKENKLMKIEGKDFAINKPIEGVLLIDEAYLLTPSAISTLIKEIENAKGNLVVIFADNKEKIKIFLDENHEIAAKIGYKLEFSDYTVDELIEIFYTKVKEMGFECEDEIKNKLINLCEYYSKTDTFNNGKFIDKVIQKTLFRHAMNDSDDIRLITVQDIPDISMMDLDNYI